MWTKVVHVPAPSICAASSTSPVWDCSPARSSSIMNGVHCHTSAMMIESIGNWLVQSTGEMPTVPISQFTSP